MTSFIKPERHSGRGIRIAAVGDYTPTLDRPLIDLRPTMPEFPIATDRSTEPTPAGATENTFSWELAAEAITVRIRWFGLCVGYALVNWVGRETNQPELNAILTLGAIYALIDTYYSYRRQVFLSNWPLIISGMEAVFIGMLCSFDQGLDSPFRFYYFLSVLVCAVRYSPRITYSTLILHTTSITILAIRQWGNQPGDAVPFVLLVVLLGWVTWASTALTGLVKVAGRRLQVLNRELQQNQQLLEERILDRTRELQKSQALLVQQEKQAAFGLLAAGIAHEVGNPLAAISSLVQMLNRRPADDYTRERLQMVDDQLTRIQRTLRELVDFSRPATSELSLADIQQVLDEALSIAKYYKRKKGKRIVTHYAEGLPRVRIVRDQLVQVFLNLILNAMDATDEGSTIEISTRLEDGRILVDVKDNGHGIQDIDQAQIFQPYFTTKSTGTGLGLFVCQHILQQHAYGEITLSRSDETGTTFTVSLEARAEASDRNSPEPGNLREAQTT